MSARRPQFPLLVIFLSFLLVVLGGSSTAESSASTPGAQPTVTVRTHPNVETTGLLLTLAFDYRFGDFSLPVIDRARNELAGYRQHPAVLESRDLVQMLGIDGYTLLALRAEPFGGPNAGRFRTALPAGWAKQVGEGDTAAGRARLEAYLQQVAAFYREADVGAFLAAQQPGYARAEAEVSMVAPDPALIAAMEEYFGKRLQSYTIIPTLTNPPHGNVGAAIDCAESTPPPSTSCRDAFFVMGAHVSVPHAAFDRGAAAGFYNQTSPLESRQRTTDLVLHEFGHAFVNSDLQSPPVWAAIADYDSLMIAPLRERMVPQAYTTWSAVAVEHVVRTTEIRVALAVGEADRAERLRRTYLEDRAFIYLPWLEAAAEQYERRGPMGTGEYATFGAFVPEMVAAFGTVDPAEAYAHLGLGGGPLRRVTIRVAEAVPTGETVYVTGNHAALSNWNPSGLPLQLAEDGTWARTVEVEEGTRLEYKATRGSWDTEAADAAGRPLRNASVFIRSDTTVTLTVEQWLDEEYE